MHQCVFAAQDHGWPRSLTDALITSHLMRKELDVPKDAVGELPVPALDEDLSTLQLRPDILILLAGNGWGRQGRM